MKLPLAAALLVAGLHGCAGNEPDRSQLLGGPVPEDTVKQQQACEKRGGRWGTGGKAGFFVCYETTRDGGKTCHAGTECEGLCLARSQSCAPVRPLFGCQDIFTDDGTPGTICID